MNNSKYQWILYVIVTVIVSTIAIQFYWNYKNYEINKQQLINEVQSSLDKAIENYYADLAEKSTIGFAFEATSSSDVFGNNKVFDSILKEIDIKQKKFGHLDSFDIDVKSNGISVFRGLKADSLLSSIHEKHHHDSTKKQNVRLERVNFKTLDSSITSSFENLTSKVIISMTSDSLRIKDVDSFFIREIASKQLDIKHQLQFLNPEDNIDSLKHSIERNSELYTTSQSPFLPNDGSLYVSFSNATKEILKRSLTGILISSLLVLAVISCLYYLLRIIKHQKQLAELKNDLISNITHEFKTPIATIGVALESIKDFDMLNDKEKTKSYLNMSSMQLSKLNIMVEKLLETATLDSQNLKLNKDTINVVELIEALIKKHQLTTNKTIAFDSKNATYLIDVDIFHFENAISNIIDNAIKYGGELITISLKDISNALVLTISDNGNTLTKAHKERIFEKFYRVPKGNTHDVKGFGIGLYYTKTIIEKHSGTIALDLSDDLTTFKTALPYVK